MEARLVVCLQCRWKKFNFFWDSWPQENPKSEYLGFAQKVEIEMLQERKHYVLQNEPLHSAEAG